MTPLVVGALALGAFLIEAWVLVDGLARAAQARDDRELARVVAGKS